MHFTELVFRASHLGTSQGRKDRAVSQWEVSGECEGLVQEGVTGIISVGNCMYECTRVKNLAFQYIFVHSADS